jgi:hypothetical protein
MNTKNLMHGIAGGLAGGVVFGIMMGMMGMLPMIGKMAGHPTAAAGFAVHLVISAMIGAGFAATVGRNVCGARSGLLRGLLYGGTWWFLGPLTLMPLMMGMGLGTNWNAAAATQMLPSLFGHLIYGVILGVSYARLGANVPRCVGATPGATTTS